MKILVSNQIIRVIFALTMIFFAFGHFMNAKAMAGSMLKGWPIGEFLTYLSGLGLALAGVAFIINKQVKLAGYLLALLLIIIVAGVHVPGLMSQDPTAKMIAMSMAVKDTAIAMGALALANMSES